MLYINAAFVYRPRLTRMYKYHPTEIVSHTPASSCIQCLQLLREEFCPTKLSDVVQERRSNVRFEIPEVCKMNICPDLSE